MGILIPWDGLGCRRKAPCDPKSNRLSDFEGREKIEESDTDSDDEAAEESYHKKFIVWKPRHYG